MDYQVDNPLPDIIKLTQSRSISPVSGIPHCQYKRLI